MKINRFKLGTRFKKYHCELGMKFYFTFKVCKYLMISLASMSRRMMMIMMSSVEVTPSIIPSGTSALSASSTPSN